MTPARTRSGPVCSIHSGARQRDPGDERQVIVSLAPEGEAMRSEVDAIMTAIGEAAGCTLEEMAGMREMLQRLRKSLNAAAGG